MENFTSHIKEKIKLAYGILIQDVYKRQMIKFAGLGIAMGNAQEPVKKAANYITLSNEEDGVAAVSYTHLDVYKRQVSCLWYLRL